MTNRAMTNRAEEFAARLQELESSRDVEAFVAATFADDAILMRPEPGRELRGLDGARTFWREYLDVFADVRSTFRRVHDGEVGVLEWVSEVTSDGGSAVTYAGVSLLDFDDEGKVRRFATYYDTRLFQL